MTIAIIVIAVIAALVLGNHAGRHRSRGAWLTEAQLPAYHQP
jgi:hypothetical protein